ncbi:hypothetical protein [Comamonas sp. GB3 AK4-5]|uniref:hypothetical protein n=1 Tax=Comamonas sp. GB3 AK4-5 TaxID=3231487 RepID=UPI00351EE8E8
MARLPHIKQRLENWAMWRARRESHGLGFASRNMLANWMASAGEVSRYSRDVTIPVLHLEAEETDEAVEAMRLGYGHLHVTLMCVYVKDLGAAGTARHMRRQPSTVYGQLDQADRWIDAYLQAKRDAKDALLQRASARLGGAP